MRLRLVYVCWIFWRGSAHCQESHGPVRSNWRRDAETYARIKREIALERKKKPDLKLDRFDDLIASEMYAISRRGMLLF